RSRLHIAHSDGRESVGTAIKANDYDFVESCSSKSRYGADRHSVIAGDHALDVMVGLNHGLNFVERFGLTPICALLSNQFESIIFIEDVMKAPCAHGRVCVGFSA